MFSLEIKVGKKLEMTHFPAVGGSSGSLKVRVNKYNIEMENICVILFFQRNYKKKNFFKDRLKPLLILPYVTILGYSPIFKYSHKINLAFK